MQNPSRQLAQKIIDKGKWGDMLSRFKEVLRVNLFIVDGQGEVLLPFEESKYGGKLLLNKAYGFNFLQNKEDFLKDFEQQGMFRESVNRFTLNCFAVPINLNNQQTIAYLIVGPVILNKRLETAQYEELAKKFNVDAGPLLEEINSIRVVSNVMMNSILDLLTEIIRDTVELSLKVNEGEGAFKMDSPVLAKEVKDTAKELYSEVRLDELLVTLLDVALKMTNTECGSIMVLESESGDLTIKVAKGLDKNRVEETRIKMGQGISGWAASENVSLLIDGQQIKGGSVPQNRVKNLLTRPEIKHALVMPLVSKDKVFGVLNLHTKKEDNKIEDNLDNLQYPTKLLSAAF